MIRQITQGGLGAILALLSLISLVTTPVVAQQIAVQGTVKDAQTNEALAATTVTVKGTSTSTQTGQSGEFTINASAGQTLVFTSMGYAEREITITDSQILDIRLVPEIGQLEELVVVGYGTQKRSDITGSVASVPKSRLSQIPVTNVMQAVQGSVAGVNVSQPSSVPGAVPSTIVRGQNSIRANTGPFVVVDGIPLSKTGGSLNDINPNDIESMEILKDASAVAIYGTNGSQGVLLITTKRGATGKPTIRYSGHTGVENFANVLEPRSAEEFTAKYVEWLRQTGQQQPHAEAPVRNFGEIANYLSGTHTDWMDVVSQTGVLQDHNLNVSGGTENVKYFISGGLMNQKGVLKGYQYQRASFRSNLDIKITDFLTVGTSAFVANNNYDGGRANLLNATAMSPYGDVYNPDGTYKIMPMEPEQLYLNPLLGLTTDRIDRNTNVNGNGYAEVDFSGWIDGLKYRANVGYTFLPLRRGSYVGRPAYDLRGTAETFSSETYSYTVENVLTYNKDWGRHHIDVTALYSAQERRYLESRARAVGFVNDELSFYNLSAGATQEAFSYRDRHALLSQMARINYGYDSRYLFTLTGRRDGSSVFGANTSKYGFFPSAAVAWNMGNEAFMQDVNWVDHLKVRLSYGKSGNEAIPVFNTITTNSTNRFPFNGISTIGVGAGNLGNRNLIWETSINTNIGVDFGLFNSRINGTLEVYETNTSDLLLQRALPILTGYGSVLDNMGKTRNKGVELTLNTRNIENTNFRWESTVVFAANRNEITELYGDGRDDIGNRWFIGQPIQVIYDFQKIGIWQEGEDWSTLDPGAGAGHVKFADIDGDGLITPEGDRIILGQVPPKWTGGFTNTFHYKNWHLNVFIQTVQGVTRNNPDIAYGDQAGNRNTPRDIGYWTPENMSDAWPSLEYRNIRGYGFPQNASFTRLKDATLSYVFEPSALQRLRLNGLTLYVSGRNLLTLTDWIGWDPETVHDTRGSGNWANNYPLTRSFVFGINISL